MGILDSMFGGGGGGQEQAPQGPQSPGVLGRMQAQYAPGAYEAVQQASRQKAVYDAAMQTQGMSPQIAQALAMSPQFFGAQQQSYLPQATQITPLQNSDGSQRLVQTSNPGGVAGHGHSLSGIPITEPPGTTPAPEQAAGAQGATPTTPATQGAADDANTPAPIPGAKNTLQGMPGGTDQILAQIQANQAAGKNPMLGVPEMYRGMAQAVREGRETLKDITSARGAPTRNIVNAIIQTAEPEFDENMNEARNNYRKQYVSGKATDIGGQVKSLNKLAGHANAMADAAKEMDNIGMGGFGGLAHPVNKLANAIYTTPGAGLKRASDLYNNELSSYVSGKGGSGVEERKARDEAFSPNRTPQEMGKSLLTDIEFLQKQIEGNEQHRNQVFSDPKMAGKFPLASPEAVAQLNQAKVKAHKLVGDYDEWSQTPEGQGLAGVNNTLTAPKAGLPPGWKFVK